MTVLFGPERHELLAGGAWSEAAARAAIEQWADAAHQAFDPDTGWPPHPRDDADPPDDPMHFLYCGSGGAIWALEHLADLGAVDRQHDFRPFVDGIVQRNRANTGQPLHGTQSFLLGDSGLLLLQWTMDRSEATAQRLFDTVQSNLHNPAREPLWGSPGSMLAAIAMAEHTGAPHWAALVRQAVQVLWDEMEPIADAGGAWAWVQHLYGRVETLIGAGHGFVGNVFPALRGAAFIEPAVLGAYAERALVFLQATAIRDGDFVNWWPSVPRHASNKKPPFLQDCHGAPGLLSRLAAWPPGRAACRTPRSGTNCCARPAS